MAGFGKRPWGVSPFGSILFGITGTPEEKVPTGSVTKGAPAGTGASGPEVVISLSEFENAIFNSTSGETINPQHISAYVKSFDPALGSAEVINKILKTKTWSSSDSYVAYDQGFLPDTADLGVVVKAAGRVTSDLSAHIFSFGSIFTGIPVDVQATLQPHNLEDLQAIVATIDAVNLPAQVESIPGINLPGQADPVASINLGATSGAHPPEDVAAYIASVFPVDMEVFIRGGFSDTLQLAASIVQSGQVGDMQAVVTVASTTVKDIIGSLRVIGRGVNDLPAQVQPHRLVDLPASIITQRIRDVRAIITGVSQIHSDLHASIARIDSASFDIIGHIAAKFIDIVDVTAALHVVGLGGTDIPSSLTSVAPFININSVILKLVPLINLDADLTSFGGFLETRASITPVHTTSTETAEDSGFLTTASSYRLYLGTTRGFFVPPQNIPKIVTTTHSNEHDLPDLHATIAAWNQADLSAAISVYPSTDVPATLYSLDLDHLSNLSAGIGVYWPKDVLP